MRALCVDEWISAFAPVPPHRVRCTLCGRELYGQSRRRHAQIVHARLLADRSLVHTRGKWQTRAALMNTQPQRSLR